MSFKTINLEKINAYLAVLSLGKSVRIGQFSLGKSEEGHILHASDGSFSYAFFLAKNSRRGLAVLPLSATNLHSKILLFNNIGLLTKRALFSIKSKEDPKI